MNEVNKLLSNLTQHLNSAFKSLDSSFIICDLKSKKFLSFSEEKMMQPSCCTKRVFNAGISCFIRTTLSSATNVRHLYFSFDEERLVNIIIDRTGNVEKACKC